MLSINSVLTDRLCTFCCSLHIVQCQNTSIHDVSIYGDFNSPNNDGIDIEDSNNTLITRVTIDTGDDAICPKTYTGPLYNLTVTDCWIRTKSSAIKLGSASWFDFKGLVFDNITIVESHRGLGLQIRDGGMHFLLMTAILLLVSGTHNDFPLYRKCKWHHLLQHKYQYKIL